MNIMNKLTTGILLVTALLFTTAAYAEEAPEKPAAVTTANADMSSLVLKDPAPAIALIELADSSVNFNCRPWVKTADYWTVYSDVTRSVKEAFDRENISIPYPQMDVHTDPVKA